MQEPIVWVLQAKKTNMHTTLSRKSETTQYRMCIKREPIMTVLTLFVFYIQKQYDDDGYVAI